MSHGPVFRAVSAFMAGLVFVQSSLAGAISLGQAVGQGAQDFRIGPLRSASEQQMRPSRPPITRPVPANGKFRGWWSQERLQQRRARLIQEAIENGDVFASTSGMFVADVMSEPGGGGPNTSGEAPGGSGGSSVTGSPSIGGGLIGQTNTATGNHLTALPLFQMPVAGDLEIEFTIFHNSIFSSGTGPNFANEPVGRKWRHNYQMRVIEESNGDATVVMPDGLEAPFDLDQGVFKRPEGFLYTLVKETNGTWTLQHRSGSQWRFGTHGHLTELRDRGGNKVTVVRAGAADNFRVTQVYGDDVAAARRTLEFQYGTDGSLDMVFMLGDNANRGYSLVHDATHGRLITIAVIDGGWSYRDFQYNAHHNITQELDDSGELATWSYSTLAGQEHRVVQRTLGGIVTWASDYGVRNVTLGNGQVITNANWVTFDTPSRGIEEHIYENSKLRMVRDYMGFQTIYEYHNDADRNLHKVWVDHGGGQWRVTEYLDYNTMGQPQEIRGPVVNQKQVRTELTYNTRWDVIEQRVEGWDTNNSAPTEDLKTSYVYDAFGRLFQVKNDANEVVQSFTYNSRSEVVDIFDGLNRKTTLTYDGNNFGDVVMISAPGVGSDRVDTSISYDFGQPIEVSVEGEVKQAVEYDGFGRVTTSTAGGVSTLSTYTFRGKPKTHTVLGTSGQPNRVSEWTYDAAGRLTSFKNSKNETTTYTYVSNRLQVASMTNGKGIRTDYSYNDRGDLTRMRMPQNGNNPTVATHVYEEEWAYTPAGEISAFSARERVNGAGAVLRSIGYTYRQDGQLSLIDHPGTTDDVTFTYDTLGRRTAMNDAQATDTTWAYNNVGRVSQMNSPQGNVGYEYDVTGEMTKLKNLQPSGPSLDTTYVYGASSGRLGRVTSAWNEHTDFVYDNQGRLIRKDLPNGLKEELSYDAQGRLSQVRVMNGTTELRKEQWTYNVFGEVAAHSVDVDGPNSTSGNTRTTYGYDTLGLLASEVRVAPQVAPTPDTPLYSASYNYDPNGNRTSRTRSINGGAAEVDVYHYDHGDKLLHIERTVQSVTNRFRTYEYNGLGETTRIYNGTTSAAFTQFNWNNDGRITGMDLPGTANDPTFRYNGFGTRVDRTVGTSTEVWKRAGAGVTASVLNDGTANFTPGISSRVGSTSTFTHAGLKNTGAQSEGLTITGTKTYDAFGLETATSGSWKTAFGYAGIFGYQRTDAGMKLLGHRHYDPETGRFLSRDPVKDGRNWYAYGAGLVAAPNMSDPTGLFVYRILKEMLQNGASRMIPGKPVSRKQAIQARSEGKNVEVWGNANENAYRESYDVDRASHSGRTGDSYHHDAHPGNPGRPNVRPQPHHQNDENPGHTFYRQAGEKLLAIGLFLLMCTDPVSAAQGASDYFHEHDDEWREGIENWYSRRGGFDGENVFCPGFLAGG